MKKSNEFIKKRKKIKNSLMISKELDQELVVLLKHTVDILNDTIVKFDQKNNSKK